MRPIIKALSIQQPWAWAILCAGKDVVSIHAPARGATTKGGG